jgi:hypothetical protein
VAGSAALWQFFPIGYLLTTAIETPVLWLGLSRRHSPHDRIAAGLWLTAVTYPIVVVALPLALASTGSRLAILGYAETFAPLAECGLFYLAFIGRTAANGQATVRDFAAIVLANLASFGCGEIAWWALG